MKYSKLSTHFGKVEKYRNDYKNEVIDKMGNKE